MKTLGERIALDEMSYPDWRKKLERGIRDLDAGRYIELEAFLKTLRKKSRRSARGK